MTPEDETPRDETPDEAPACDVFHAGERSVQARTGVAERAERLGARMLPGRLSAQHREFFEALPFVIAAVRDHAGQPWVTLLGFGRSFMHAPSDERLEVHALPLAGDALAGALVPGADVGLLGIDFATRRRNRVNGQIVESSAQGFAVEVTQAYGNCPRFISERHLLPRTAGDKPLRSTSSQLAARHAQWLRSADTFFIASGYGGQGKSEAFGMDASHRGGNPGFVSVTSPRGLTFPDYAGNNLFNTLGNLQLDERAGLLFVDFSAGHLLQLAGRARVDWDERAAAQFAGAKRLVHFEIDSITELEHALSFRFRAPPRAGTAE